MPAAPASMHGVFYRRFGPPEVLEYGDLPTPAPAAGEVLVRVLATAVDYIHLHMRRGGSGRIGSFREPMYGLSQPPYFPGGGACVEVVALGPDVADVTLGSRHLCSGLRPGAYVEYATVNAAAVRPRADGRPGPTAYPPTFTPIEAAAFDYAPVAYHTLKIAAGLQANETVLIHAAAGGTGSLAVQLAKAFGAKVIATASNPEKLALARKLGADVTIDYARDDFVAAVRDATHGRGVDVVWESVGGVVFTRSLEALAEGGRLVSFGANALEGTGIIDFLPFWVKNIRLIGWGGASNTQAHAPEVMAPLLALAAQGALRPLVRHVLPFRLAAEAHRLIESRQSIGKVVLTP